MTHSFRGTKTRMRARFSSENMQARRPWNNKASFKNGEGKPFQPKKKKNAERIYHQQICSIGNVTGNFSGRKKMIPGGNLYLHKEREQEMENMWRNIKAFFSFLNICLTSNCLKQK